MAVVITYEDKEYTLDYSRDTIRQMEKAGFVLDQLFEKPATMIPLLFQGAFLMHHKKLVQDKPNYINEIFNHLTQEDEDGDKDADTEETEKYIVTPLVEAYRKSMETIVTGGEKVSDSKKATWKVVE